MSTITSLSPNSKVWIYQSNTPFEEGTLPNLEKEVTAFAEAWTSHNNALQSSGTILHKHFIILAVDESQAGASGCSIDKSVRFIQSIEQRYGVKLFDRFSFAYRDEAKNVQVVPKDKFAKLYETGKITDETVVFNNLVKTVGDLKEKWEVRLSNSWHRRFV